MFTLSKNEYTCYNKPSRKVDFTDLYASSSRTHKHR